MEETSRMEHRSVPPPPPPLPPPPPPPPPPAPMSTETTTTSSSSSTASTANVFNNTVITRDHTSVAEQSDTANKTNSGVDVAAVDGVYGDVGATAATSLNDLASIERASAAIPGPTELTEADMIKLIEEGDPDEAGLARRKSMLRAKLSANWGVRIAKQLGRNILNKAEDVGIGLMGVGEGIADTGERLGKGVGVVGKGITTGLGATGIGGVSQGQDGQTRVEEVDTVTDIDITGTILRDLYSEIEQQKAKGANSAESPLNTMWVLLIFPIMPLAFMYTKVFVSIVVPPLWNVIYSVWTYFGWRFWLCCSLVFMLSVCINWNNFKQIEALKLFTMRIDANLIKMRKKIQKQIEKSLPKVYKALDKALPYVRAILSFGDEKLQPKLGYSPILAIKARLKGWRYDPRILDVRHGRKPPTVQESGEGTDSAAVGVEERDTGHAQIVTGAGITNIDNLEFNAGDRARESRTTADGPRRVTDESNNEGGLGTLATPAGAHSFGERVVGNETVATFNLDDSVAPPALVEPAAPAESAGGEAGVVIEDEVYEKYYDIEIRLKHLAELHRQYSSVWVEWIYDGMVIERSVIRDVSEDISRWKGYGADMVNYVLHGEVKLPFHPKELSPDGNDLILSDAVFDDTPITLVFKGRDGMPLYANDGARRYMRESARIYHIGEINLSAKKIGIGHSIDAPVRSELRIPFHAPGSRVYRTAVLYCSVKSTPVDPSSYSYRQLLTGLPNGEWTVRVNVFELRNLRAVDNSGSSDPYVQVSTLGQTKETDMYRKTLSCIVNQMLFFSKVRSGLQFEDEKIELSVMDWNRFGASKKIGSYTFDAKRIFEQPQHEVHRKWFALHNPKYGKRPAGFVKLSVTIVPPGSMPPRHEEAEDREEFTSATLLKNTVIRPPPMAYENWAVHITIGWADMLPKISSAIDRDVIRGYVQLGYTGFTLLETNTFIAEARDIVDPNVTEACHVLPQRRVVWNEEFILPLTIINNRVAQEGVQLKVFHRRSTSFEAPILIGQISISFLKLYQNQTRSVIRGQAADDEQPGDRVAETAMLRPSYHNFYGKPTGDSDVYDKGVAFRGRLLAGVAAKPGNVAEPYVRPCLPPPRPRLAFYKLNFSVLRATELNLDDGWSVRIECNIGLFFFGHTIPNSQVRSNCVAWDENCSVSIPNLQFPEDVELIPDLFITLWARMPKTVPVLEGTEKDDAPSEHVQASPSLSMRTPDEGQVDETALLLNQDAESKEEATDLKSPPPPSKKDKITSGDKAMATGGHWKRKAFLRLPSKHLILNAKEQNHEWMFMDYPGNNPLREGNSFVPGSLLVHASLSSYDPSEAVHDKEKESMEESVLETIAVSAEERVEDGGLNAASPRGVSKSDPFTIEDEKPDVSSSDESMGKTRAPVTIAGIESEYELRALIFKGRSLPAADASGMSDPYLIVSMGNQTVAGTVTCKATVSPIWNERIIIPHITVRDGERKPNINVRIFDDNEEDDPDYLGRAIIPCSELDDRHPSLEYAKWYPVFSVNPGRTVGEVLADFQLIPQDVAFSQPLIFPDIPSTRSALRVSLVGLRDVKFLQYASGTMFVEVTVSGDVHRRTSKRGAILQQGAYQANCSILDVLVLPISIPSDLRLAPTLNVCVFADLTHMRKSEVVATAAIPLEDFLHEHERNLISGANLNDDSFGMDMIINDELLSRYVFRKKALKRSLKAEHSKTSSTATDTKLRKAHSKSVQPAHLHKVKGSVGFEQGSLRRRGTEEARVVKVGFPEERKPSKFAKQAEAVVSALQRGFGKLSVIIKLIRSMKYSVEDFLADLMPDVAMALGIEPQEDITPLSSLIDLHGSDDEVDYDGTRRLKRERGFCPHELEVEFSEAAYGEFLLFRGDNRDLGNAIGGVDASHQHKEANPKIPPLIPVDEGKTKEELLAAEKRRATLQGTRPAVGKVKARLDLIEVDPEDDLEVSKVRLASLRGFGRIFIPTEVVVRVYVLRGLALQQVGGKCNPYLTVRFFGGYPDVYSGKRNPVENDSTPNFFQYFESRVKMPGGSVRVEVKDRVLPEVTLPLKSVKRRGNGLIPFGVTDLDIPLKFGKLGLGWSENIGETVIDLDSRWYNAAWRSLKKTPVELRALYGEESINMKGQLELFVDIFDAQDVDRRPKLYRPVPIKPPEQREYEIRLVVYKIQDVYLPYQLVDNDPAKLASFYVHVKLGNLPEHEHSTDTCRYVGDAQAEFMWRMRWSLKLPDMDIKPRLKLQVFDDTSAGLGNDQLCAICDIKLRTLFDDLVTHNKSIIKKKQWVQMKHPNYPEVEAQAQISLELLPKQEAMKKVCFTGKAAYLNTDKQHEDYNLPIPFRPAAFSIMNPAPYFTYLITSTLMNVQHQLAILLLVFPFIMVFFKFAWATPWTWYFAGGCSGAVIFVRIMMVQNAKFQRMQADVAAGREELEETGES